MVGNPQSDVETARWFKAWLRRAYRRHLHYVGPRGTSALQLFVCGVVARIDAAYWEARQ